MPNSPALLPSVGLTPTGLSLSPNVSPEEWEEVGYTLSTLDESALPWAWGDWLLARPKGLKDEDAVQVSGKPWETLRVYRWTAEAIPPVRRRTALSFGHHSAVAGLPEATQAALLDDAELTGSSVAGMKAKAKALRDPAPAEVTAHGQDAEQYDSGPDSGRPPVEVVDPIEELEREYGIERTGSGATPKNAVRSAIKAAVGSLVSLISVMEDVTTWPPDLAAEFAGIWTAASALGEKFTARQEEAA